MPIGSLEVTSTPWPISSSYQISSTIADRLWIQRPIPKLPKPLKRKRPERPAQNFGKPTSRPQRKPAKRQRLQSSANPVSQVVNGRLRSANTRAKAKLVAQAKEVQKQVANGSGQVRDGSTFTRPAPRRPLGTRISARLRGDVHEDEWQHVPEEWLADHEEGMGKSGDSTDDRVTETKHSLRTGLESDEGSVSDLTDLSDEREGLHVELPKHPQGMPELTRGGKPPTLPTSDQGPGSPPAAPQDFVEWETVSIAPDCSLRS